MSEESRLKDIGEALGCIAIILGFIGFVLLFGLWSITVSLDILAKSR